MPQPNDQTPLDVTIQDTTGNPTSLRSLLGKYIVLYFYPADDTPGCTTEACAFRDSNSKLQDLGVVVLGVSKDSAASHEKFIDKYHLNFPLWSDTEHRLMEAFGTWQEKINFGKKYMGTTRSTFVIDPTGKIVKVWKKVTPEGHADKVYSFIKGLKDGQKA